MRISKDIKRKIVDRAVSATGVRVDETLLKLEAVCLNLDMTVTDENGIYIKLLEKIIKSQNSLIDGTQSEKVNNDKTENDLIFI